MKVTKRNCANEQIVGACFSEGRAACVQGAEGRRTDGEKNPSRKHRENMAAVQITHPKLFDFWQKIIKRYLMANI